MRLRPAYVVLGFDLFARAMTTASLEFVHSIPADRTVHLAGAAATRFRRE